METWCTRAPDGGTSRGWLTFSAVLWGGALVYLGLAPRLPRLGGTDLDGWSPWSHAFGALVLAALLYLLLAGSESPRRRLAAWSALLVTIALLGFVEVLQALTPERHPSLVDGVFDVGGAAIGSGLAAALSRRAGGPWALRRPAAWAALGLSVVVGASAVLFTPGPQRASDCDTTTLPVEEATRPVSVAPPGRVTEGLVALYRFEGGQRTVRDASGVGRALDLRLTGNGTSWVGERLAFDGGAARSMTPARKISAAVNTTGELTLEAWLRPYELGLGGPARIVTVSEGVARGQVNAHLGQDGRGLSVRVRARCGQFNWQTIPDVFTSTVLPVHVAVTFAGHSERVYVGGELRYAALFEGGLGGWNLRYPLVVGNEATLDRPLHGEVFLAAVYDRALSGGEVAHNAAVGPPDRRAPA